MAKIIKQISGALGATVEAVASITTSIAGSSVASIDTAGQVVNNSLTVASNYSAEFVNDSELSLAQNELVSSAKLQIIKETLADEGVIKKLKEQAKSQLLEDLFD